MTRSGSVLSIACSKSIRACVRRVSGHCAHAAAAVLLGQTHQLPALRATAGQQFQFGLIGPILEAERREGSGKIADRLDPHGRQQVLDTGAEARIAGVSPRTDQGFESIRAQGPLCHDLKIGRRDGRTPLFLKHHLLRHLPGPVAQIQARRQGRQPGGDRQHEAITESVHR